MEQLQSTRATEQRGSRAESSPFVSAPVLYARNAEKTKEKDLRMGIAGGHELQGKADPGPGVRIVRCPSIYTIALSA